MVRDLGEDDETFWAETDKALVHLEMVSRPRCQDRDHIDDRRRYLNHLSIFHDIQMQSRRWLACPTMYIFSQ